MIDNSYLLNLSYLYPYYQSSKYGAVLLDAGYKNVYLPK